MNGVAQGLHQTNADIEKKKQTLHIGRMAGYEPRDLEKLCDSRNL